VRIFITFCQQVQLSYIICRSGCNASGVSVPACISCSLAALSSDILASSIKQQQQHAACMCLCEHLVLSLAVCSAAAMVTRHAAACALMQAGKAVCSAALFKAWNFDPQRHSTNSTCVGQWHSVVQPCMDANAIMTCMSDHH
jgi:hypothetical protein